MECLFGTLAKERRDRKQVEYAEVRVMSPEIGVQKEVSWLPLIGITYDAKDDIIDLSVESMNHMIPKPRELYVDGAEDGQVTCLEVRRKDGIVELIELR
ncbi:MAG: DUF5335 family protein [Rhodothermales bacterium]|nr:DUF5335 family protein [Rhodothermales bacterium]